MGSMSLSPSPESMGDVDDGERRMLDVGVAATADGFTRGVALPASSRDRGDDRLGMDLGEAIKLISRLQWLTKKAKNGQSRSERRCWNSRRTFDYLV